MNHTFSGTRSPRHLLFVLAMGIALCVGIIPGTAQSALDAMSALEVLKRNDCTKCHSVKKSKNGPSYKRVSRKYRKKANKAGAEDKIFKHLTTSPTVELEDGTKEEHKRIDIKNPDHIREFVRWILSL